MDIQDSLTEIKTVQRYNFDVTNFDDEKRTIEFVFTTNTTDRSNDIVNPKGAILDDFKNNPVFLWSHDKTKQPLGRVVEIEIEEDGSLVGTVEFWRNNIDPAYWSEADKVAVSAGTRDVAFRRSRVTLRTFAVIFWTVTAGLCWISNPALIAKAVVRHRILQANDG